MRMGRPFGILTEKEIDGSEALIRERTGDRSLVLFDSGDAVTVQPGEDGIRFLLVSGKPLRELAADRDEHAGLSCNGRPSSFGTEPFIESTVWRCCNCIAAVALPSPETRKAEIVAGQKGHAE